MAEKLLGILSDVRERKRKSGFHRRGTFGNAGEEPFLDEESKRKIIGKIQRHVREIKEAKEGRLSRLQQSLEQALAGGGPDAKDHMTDDMLALCAELGLKMEKETPWVSEVWFTLFRLRQAFFLMCAFAILLSLFAGLLMEIFFSIMGGAHIHFSSVFLWLKWHFIFWLLPFFMMILALLGDEMCDLILDSLDFPALHVFQATLVTALNPWGKDAVSLTSMKISDRLLFFVFEGVPILVAIYFAKFLAADLGQGVATVFLEGYIQGSLLSAVLCTILFVFADVVVSSQARGEDRRSLIRREVVSDAIDSAKMQPYCLARGFAASAPDSVDEESARATVDEEAKEAEVQAEQTGLCSLRCIKVLCFAVVAVWTACVLVFTSFNKTAEWYDPVILGASLVLTVTFCSWALHRHCPDIYGAPYVMILAFFVLVGVSLNISSAVQPEQHGSSMEAIMSVLPEDLPAGARGGLPASWPGVPFGLTGTSSADLGLPGPARALPQPYPICGREWGSPHSPLRALDLANLAWMIYDESPGQAHMELMLNRSYPAERRAQVVHVEDYMTLPRWGHFYFPPAGNATRGTRVIAVKGTSTVMDALVDTNLFSTVKVLQMFNQVLPVLVVLPRLVIQYLLKNVHLGTARLAEIKIWTRLEKEVSTLQKQYPEDDFVITGHSLGGGLSQIAAAKLFVPAVVWSAPGAEYSAKRFGIEVQSVKRNVVSIMPDHDVVPRVDLQAGTLQLIECRKQDGSEASALQCHSLVKTSCEIWRACGDPRDFRRTCAPYVAPGDLGRLYAVDDSTA